MRAEYVVVSGEDWRDYQFSERMMLSEQRRRLEDLEAENDELRAICTELAEEADGNG